MNAPALVLIGGLGLYPIVFSVWISLHRYNLVQPDRFDFIGLDNYRKLLGDPAFWSSIRTTMVIGAAAVAITLVMGLALALLLNVKFWGGGLLRAAVLVPWTIPPIVNALMWKLTYNASFGVLNGTLFDLGIIREYVPWLSRPDLALVAVLTAHVWNNVPIATLPILAGMQAIPAELYEAAEIDGASHTQRFRHITLPYLAAPILVALILETMISFKIFDLIYTLTSGGPANATDVLGWQTYKIAFSGLDFGYGSAWSNMLALIILVVSAGYVAFLYRRQADA